MKHAFTTTVSTLMLALFASTAMAQAATGTAPTNAQIAAPTAAPIAASAPTPDQRDAAQQKRIEQGQQNGSLNARETARLERGQARSARIQARAGKDGQIGEAEQARIDQNQDHQSRRIVRQKHDAQNRPDKG